MQRRLNWRYAIIWTAAATAYFGAVILIGRAVSW